MRRSSLAVVLFSSGLMLSACGSSGGGGNGGTGGQAGSGTGGASGRGGTGGPGGGGGTSGAGGYSGTGGAGGSSGSGGTTGTAGTGGGGGSAGGGGAAGAGGSAGSSGGAGGTAGGGGAGAAAGGGGAGGAGGVGGSAGGGSGGSGGSGGTGGTGGTPLTAQQMRGQYLATAVLGCAGCHTPSGGAQFSGTDCFVKSGATGCLSSANLTNDPSGLMNYTDQQIKDAFTKGMDPGAAGKYLFSNMPYYQFGTLSDADSSAIVAYLRTVPGVSHTVQASTAPFDVLPTSPDWAAVDPATLPAASPAAGPTNGKYLATLVCATCHTVEATGATPKHIDATKAFQGGKIVTATVSGTSKMLQTANLTPDATGLMTWNASQVAAAITTAKDKNGTTLCGMRALANMTASDATDIGTYLLGIPAVANARTMTCQ